MSHKYNSPFEAELEIVATLRDRAIQASISELKRQDELTIALRQAVRNGQSVENLSEASGLTAEEVRARMDRDLFFGEDLAQLAGNR
jgi:hypothetical protein